MITIYGHSDDLVEIEGSLCCSGEIECFDSDVIIVFEDGTKIRVGYSKPNMGGIWYILVEEQGSAATMLDVCEDPDDDPHSDIFHIDSEIKYIDFDKQQKGKELWLKQQTEKELESDDIENEEKAVENTEEVTETATSEKENVKPEETTEEVKENGEDKVETINN